MNKSRVCGLIILFLYLSFPVNSQVRADRPPQQQKVSARVLALRQSWDNERAEMVSLTTAFVKATKDYIASLEKLEDSYEKDVRRASARLQTARGLSNQGLSPGGVAAREREVKEAEKKVKDTENRLEAAGKQLSDAERELNILKLAQRPSDKELVRRYRVAARADRESRCSYWTVTSGKKSTNYKICQH